MISNKIEDYCTINSSHVPRYLLELERETNLRTVNPRMLSGDLQGRVLSMISKMLLPKRVLEVGTFTGYASLCLAEGLDREGLLETIEVNPELETIIQKYFQKSPFKDRIKLYMGDAKEILKKLPGPYDLVFLDASKEEYIQYFDEIKPKLKSGGIMLVDNVLWSGKVIEDSDDSTARAIHRFNRYVLSDDEMEIVMLPLRDGLSMIRKRG